MMTELEQRIACAELQGWRHAEGKTWMSPDRSGIFGVESMPNYPHDLNAMHEVEKTLTPEEVHEYQNILVKKVVTLDKLFPKNKTKKYPIDGYVSHTNASDRLWAYLKLKGKPVD